MRVNGINIMKFDHIFIIKVSNNNKIYNDNNKNNNNMQIRK